VLGGEERALIDSPWVELANERENSRTKAEHLDYRLEALASRLLPRSQWVIDLVLGEDGVVDAGGACAEWLVERADNRLDI
jgi:hypothetical protein